MVQKLAHALNGYSILYKAVYYILLSCVIVWTFCIVRDLPEKLKDYVTRAELQQTVGSLKDDRDKQFDRVFQEVRGINEFLRGRNYSRNSREADVGSTESK